MTKLQIAEINDLNHNTHLKYLKLKIKNKLQQIWEGSLLSKPKDVQKIKLKSKHDT